jgi:tellurite resistance protein TerC
MYKRKKDTFTIKTLKQAKRVIKIVIGFTVVMLGAAMLMLPGPGMITIILGLAILGSEFVWARILIKRFEQEANNFKNSIFNNTKKIKTGKSEIESE